MISVNPPSEFREVEARNLAAEVLYRFLSALLVRPDRDAWRTLVLDPVNQGLAASAADLLRGEFAGQSAPLGCGELPVEELDLEPLLAELHDPSFDALGEYQRVFGLVQCRECPPYETEFQPNDDAFFRAQEMADVAGFYQAFGVSLGGRPQERPDHLAIELEFAALLLRLERLAPDGEGRPETDERARICREARAAFVRDHLAWWVPSFSLALRHKAQTGIYERLGRLLAAFLPVERHSLAIQAPALPIRQPTLTPPPEECAGCAAAAPG